MNKYNSLTPADRILSYLEREAQADGRVLPLDPETEALLAMSSEELEAEALLIDPDHTAHLENLRAMIGLPVEDSGADAVQPYGGTDGRDDGTEPANCNLSVSAEHRFAAKMRVGLSLVPHDRRRLAGTTAYGRLIACGSRHLARSERNVNGRLSILSGFLRFSAALLFFGMLTGSFALDYRQIQNEGESNKAIHNRLAELSSKINVLATALRASEDGVQQTEILHSEVDKRAYYLGLTKWIVQQTEILHSETDKRAYYLGLTKWLFDPNVRNINAVSFFDCPAYCKKKEWSVTREKGIYKTASYGPPQNIEKMYALGE